MANPALVACAADTWKLVASGVTSGAIYNMTPEVDFMQTYRMAGNIAPTGTSDAILAFRYRDDPLNIAASAAIDVYLRPVSASGVVRVDV